MNQDIKKCPKCGTAMTESPLFFSLPTAIPGKRSATVDPAISLLVRPYDCPKCDYVELYIIRRGKTRS